MRVGYGHEEMNMLRAFSSCYWDVMYKDFAISQGYKTDKSLDFMKSCKDHHQGWDNMLKFREAVWGQLLFHFVNYGKNDQTLGAFLDLALHLYGA